MSEWRKLLLREVFIIKNKTKKERKISSFHELLQVDINKTEGKTKDKRDTGLNSKDEAFLFGGVGRGGFILMLKQTEVTKMKIKFI